MFLKQFKDIEHGVDADVWADRVRPEHIPAAAAGLQQMKDVLAHLAAVAAAVRTLILTPTGPVARDDRRRWTDQIDILCSS